MRAAVMNRAGSPLDMEDRPRPDRGTGMVVDVLACGVCHTDLHLLDSEATRTPRVLGHEIVVTGPGGEPCLVYASWGCRRCGYCRSGDEAMCPEVTIAGVHADGGYADAVVIPDESYLYPIGDLDPVAAAPLADAGATSYRAVRRAMPAARAVVIGAGGLGQLAIQWLRMRGCRVTAIDTAAGKRHRAIELGADEARPPGAEMQPAPVVLDFVGTAESLQLANRIVERQGKIVIVGGGGGAIAVGMEAIPYEAWVTTSIMGSRADVATVLGYAQQGDIDCYVEGVQLEQANEALDRLRDGTVKGRLALVPG